MFAEFERIIHAIEEIAGQLQDSDAVVRGRVWEVQSENRFGDTQVICTASVEDRVPPFLRNSGKGWVTAEYAIKLLRPTPTNDSVHLSAAAKAHLHASDADGDGDGGSDAPAPTAASQDSPTPRRRRTPSQTEEITF